MYIAPNVITLKKNMAKKNINREFRLKNTDEPRHYFIGEINQNDLMSKKHKNVSTTLNYIKYFLILASAVTGRVSVSDFVSLVGFPIGITSSAVRQKHLFHNCAWYINNDEFEEKEYDDEIQKSPKTWAVHQIF